jgi:hypothetical protein
MARLLERKFACLRPSSVALELTCDIRPRVDEDIRNALLPNHNSGISGQSQFRTPADLRSNPQVSSSEPTAAASASPNDLGAIQSLLLKGDKREAVRYALDNKLWAHAFIISSGVDHEMRAAVIKEFMQAELSTRADGPGHEPLKVAYSLLTGSGGASSTSNISADGLLV